jgi:hypothetical protein
MLVLGPVGGCYTLLYFLSYHLVYHLPIGLVGSVAEIPY